MAGERLSKILGIPSLSGIQERQSSLVRLSVYSVLPVTVHHSYAAFFVVDLGRSLHRITVELFSEIPNPLVGLEISETARAEVA
jgi:hypothetical protein